LNALPELMILIKGMFVATRAVSCTVLLMLMIIYVFAVLFRQLTDGTELGATVFPSVTASMRFLMLSACIPDLTDVTNEIWEHGWGFAAVFMFFVLVVTITVMNMLVGVLVGVVDTVAIVEREQMMVNFVKSNLLTMLDVCKQRAMEEGCETSRQPHMSAQLTPEAGSEAASGGFTKRQSLRITKEQLAEEDNREITRSEFDILITLPLAIRSLDTMGVDVVGLVDLADFIFKDTEKLEFIDFMELIMSLRGTNQATVKDIVDLRKFIVTEMKVLHAELGNIESEIEHIEHDMPGHLNANAESAEAKMNRFSTDATATFNWC